MKTYITFFLFFALTIAHCQDKGIVLKKTNDHTVFLPEQNRIKLKTKDGKYITGTFTILDENTISINETPILIDSIVKIKNKSIFSSVRNTFLITGGSFLVLLGTVGAISGGFGVVLVVLVPPGIQMMLLPLITNNHIVEKWHYSIGTNPKHKNKSDNINENQ